MSAEWIGNEIVGELSDEQRQAARDLLARFDRDEARWARQCAQLKQSQAEIAEGRRRSEEVEAEWVRSKYAYEAVMEIQRRRAERKAGKAG